MQPRPPHPIAVRTKWAFRLSDLWPNLCRIHIGSNVHSSASSKHALEERELQQAGELVIRRSELDFEIVEVGMDRRSCESLLFDFRPVILRRVMAALKIEENVAAMKLSPVSLLSLSRTPC